MQGLICHKKIPAESAKASTLTRPTAANRAHAVHVSKENSVRNSDEIISRSREGGGEYVCFRTSSRIITSLFQNYKVRRQMQGT